MGKAEPPDLGRLGFGISGPHGSAMVPARTTCKLIEQAIIGGIRTFDTGPSYGRGEAERRLGQVLQEADRKSLFISTKAGQTEFGTSDFTPAALRDSLQRSLDRLGISSVDGFFLHGPASNDLNDEMFSALDDLRRQGLFTYLGIAGRGPELDVAIASRQFDLIMLPMGPGALPKNGPRADLAKRAGQRVIGIEMISHSRKPWRLSAHPADWWHMIRQVMRRDHAPSGQKPLSALRQALRNAQADTVLSSTTRHKHVQQWLDCLDELADAS